MFFSHLIFLAVAVYARVHRMIRVPNDVERWVDQINQDKLANGRVSHKRKKLNSKAQKPSDCSIVITLWKKMGKETTLDPETVAPTGCCRTDEKSEMYLVRCDGEKVVQM